MPRAAQIAHQREQMRLFARAQRRGRLVHHQDARAQGQRPSNFDKLLLGDSQPSHWRRRIDIDADLLQQRQGFLDSFCGFARKPHDVSSRCSHTFAATVSCGNEVELLKHHADAVSAGAFRIAHRKRSAVQPDLASVGAHNAGENAHQGGFSGTVLADQGMNGAGLAGQIDVPERGDPKNALEMRASPKPAPRSMTRQPLGRKLVAHQSSGLSISA